MPLLQFKGRVFVENFHLGVPYHELTAVRGKGLSKKASLHDNLIIEGDNLLGLKALLPTHQGKVKCIYIDPPYNTGNEGWAYNDRVNSPLMEDWLGKVVDRDDLTRHDKWCCMMLPRLKLLRELLADDGAIFVSIDDNEVHRLRALMDEVFGEENFITTIIWHKMDSPKNMAMHFSEDHDFIAVYARNAEVWRPNPLSRSDRMLDRYKNPDDDARGPWLLSDLAARNRYDQGRYSITTPSGRIIEGPPAGSYWRVRKDRFDELEKDGRIWWGKDGRNRPGIKRFLSEVREGVVPQTLWPWKEAGSTRNAKQELSQIMELGPAEDVFITPKPSTLLKRIVQIATDKDSIILDSFAGSGTTAHAVLALNKEDGGNRRFVLIECEDYVDAITAERVRRVIKGYRHSGVQRTELLNEKLSWARLKDADSLVAEVEVLEGGTGGRFDKIRKQVKDDRLIVTGEKRITERTKGLDGTFSYFKLGKALRKESLLHPDKLPSYEKLAAYIFFTATGEEFAAGKMQPERWFIGRSRNYDLFLIYADDFEQLKDMALTLDIARKLSRSKRDKLVFAPTKYVDQEFLHRFRINFQQLPFEIYETVDRLSR